MNKKRHIKLVQKDLLSVKSELIFKLKWTDSHHVCNLFLIRNHNFNSQFSSFCKLSIFVGEKVSHDLEKVVYNFSKQIQTNSEAFYEAFYENY